MEELYLVMRELLEVGYNQESLLCLLEAVETADCGKKQEEVQLIANGTRYYLKSLQEELKAAINKLDSYIVKNVKKQ